MGWTVAGAGNILCGDDGFGIRVIQALAQTTLPSNVKLLEIGVDPLALRPALQRQDKLIVVDTLAGSGQAGELYMAQLADIRPLYSFSSLHDFSYWHLLQEFLQVQGWVVGVEPENLDCIHLGLSPSVAAQIIPATKAVLGLIKGANVVSKHLTPVRR